MAYYAALVSLVQLLQEISHRDLYRQYFDVDQQQIASIYEKLRLLQSLLQDYSPKDKESADVLERRIRDAAHQAQDIIESQVSNQISELQPRRCKELRKVYQDLEKVKEEVDAIVEELMRKKESDITTLEDLKLNSYFANNSVEVPRRALSRGNTMVGFDEHVMTVKAQLCGESSKLEVVSIVGMGGIGKTTLARSIFDDELILYHFYCRAWVTVSQHYRLRKVLLDIGISMNIMDEEFSKEKDEVLDIGISMNTTNEEFSKEKNAVLVERIYKHLVGRRYLIVMDDVWDTKVWDGIKRIFPDNSNGSRIMITTRLSDVAAYADKFGFIHQLPFLNEDQSWNLFREKVFCPPELESIGRFIVNNCRGLPLAIVVVAGLLSKVNMAKYDWEEIARNISLIANENDEHFSKILSLSYDHLPHYLKPCFLYLGGFPEDSKILVSKLIKLWVAEGFLKPIESKSLEEVGEEYLKDLVNRSLVLIVEKKKNGNFKCCIIHDLLRDLCAQKASQENFLYIHSESKILLPYETRNARRLYIQDGWLNSATHRPYPTSFVSGVRSIFYFRSAEDLIYDPPSELGFKLLRVLDAMSIDFPCFPDDIVKLFHLRYLSLCLGTNILPSSISNLQNLQTLIVILSDPKLEMLPFQIWKMPQLRHVIISQLRLPAIPSDKRTIGLVGLLGRLQTLYRVIDFIFTPDIIGIIPSLKKLKVSYTYELDEMWHEFGLNNLVHLSKLETLDIRFSVYKSYEKVVARPLPESFAFPRSIKELCLYGCRLPWKDMTTVGMLSNLQVLKLRYKSFVGEEWEPTEGEFSRLKFLEMDSLYDLKYWRVEAAHFPCLEHLDIEKCYELCEIPLEVGEIPTLELIQINNSELAANSAVLILEEQRSQGNDILQVRILTEYVSDLLYEYLGKCKR